MGPRTRDSNTTTARGTPQLRVGGGTFHIINHCIIIHARESHTNDENAFPYGGHQLAGSGSPVRCSHSYGWRDIINSGRRTSWHPRVLYDSRSRFRC